MCRRLTTREHLRVADPIAKLAKGQALAAKDLLGMQRLRPETILAAVLEFRLLLRRSPLLRRRAGKRALVVLARVAKCLDLVAVLCPYASQLPSVTPALGASNIHDAADIDLAAETTVAGDDRHVVRVERDRPCRQPGLLMLAARRALVLDGLERLHSDRSVACAADNSRLLGKESPVLVEILDWPLCFTARA